MALHLDRMLYGILSGFIVFLLCFPLFLRRGKAFNKKSNFQKTAVFLLFLYVGALTFLTMIYAPPWEWRISNDSTWWAISRINFNPLKSSVEIFNNCKSIDNFKDFYLLIGGNLALLSPLAILVPIINKKYNFIKILFLAIFVSASIEGLQLLTNILLGNPYRTVEIDDFILNVLGCALTYIVFSFFKAIFHLLSGVFRKGKR